MEGKSEKYKALYKKAIGWCLLFNFISGLLMLAPLLVLTYIVFSLSFFNFLDTLLAISAMGSTIGFWYALLAFHFDKGYFGILSNVFTLVVYIILLLKNLNSLTPFHISSISDIISRLFGSLIFMFPLITSLLNLRWIYKLKQL